MEISKKVLSELIGFSMVSANVVVLKSSVSSVFQDMQKESKSHQLVHLIYEPVHEISNNVVCATSKGSDQPAHTLSLIRAFASRLSIL